jgi:hypothetical protein
MVWMILSVGRAHVLGFLIGCILSFYVILESDSNIFSDKFCMSNHLYNMVEIDHMVWIFKHW